MDQDEMERGFRNVEHRVDRVDQILPTLATKDDLQAAIAGAEHRMRKHFDVGFESLRDDIRLIADGLAMLTQKVEQNHRELKSDIAGVDRRLMRVEARGASR